MWQDHALCLGGYDMFAVLNWRDPRSPASLTRCPVSEPVDVHVGCRTLGLSRGTGEAQVPLKSRCSAC